MVVPPIVRRTRAAVDAWGEPVEGAPAEPEARRRSPTSAATSGRAGRFLRTEATLLANTLQGTAGQFAVGVVTALGFIIARADRSDHEPADVRVHGDGDRRRQPLGGFALGLVATRVAKGRLIIAAYTIFGLLVSSSASSRRSR